MGCSCTLNHLDLRPANPFPRRGILPGTRDEENGLDSRFLCGIFTPGRTEGRKVCFVTSAYKTIASARRTSRGGGNSSERKLTRA